MPNALAAREGLTAQEREFVRAFVNGQSYSQAAITAGYPSKEAAANGWRLLRTAHVLAAVHSEGRRLLVSEAPASIRTLIWLREHAESEKVRESASRTLLDRAGLIAPRAVADSGRHEQALHEMGLGELRALADRLQSEIETRAKDVSGAVSVPIEAQAADLVG